MYEDKDFISLFPNNGQPAYAPWRLALITVFQSLENLSDRQAADAVRGRLDWKYALSLELEDAGFDRSILSEFRSRLIENNAEQILLDKMLESLKEKGLLKVSKQRTDSTHVVAAVRNLRRLELAGESIRAALNAIATVEPDWLRAVIKVEWFERYSHRIEEYSFPKGRQAQRDYGLAVATDGFDLLDLIDHESTPKALKELKIVSIFKDVWEQNFERKNGKVRWLTSSELKPSGERTHSPYDPEACYATKRQTEWTGYKVHLTETCEVGSPRIITHVETTPATQQDVSTTASIQQALANKDCSPEIHIVDKGYTDADLLASSQANHDIKLVGPVRENLSWQAKAGQGFSNKDFSIDWDKKQATCPEGKVSYPWKERVNEFGTNIILVQFRPKDCQPCPSRSLCTKAKKAGRRIHLQPRKAQEALDAMRGFMASEESKALYKKRAGIEGTLSQGVRKMGLRHTRYQGLGKATLKHIAIATAINITRAVNWLRGDLPATSRISPFARLAPQT